MFKNITGKAGMLIVWLFGIWSVPLYAVEKVPPAPPVAATPATPAVPAAPAMDAAGRSYAEAYNYVLDGKWVAAIKALQTHLKNFPTSSTVDDANFWLCYSQSKNDQL